MIDDLKAKLKKLGKQHVIESERATEFTGKYIFDLDELAKLIEKGFADGQLLGMIKMLTTINRSLLDHTDPDTGLYDSWSTIQDFLPATRDVDGLWGVINYLRTEGYLDDFTPEPTRWTLDDAYQAMMNLNKEMYGSLTPPPASKTKSRVES